MKPIFLTILFLVSLGLTPVAAENWILVGSSPDSTKIFYDKDRVRCPEPGRVGTWVKTSHPKYKESKFSIAFDLKDDKVYWAKNKKRDLKPGDVFSKLRSELLKVKPDTKK